MTTVDNVINIPGLKIFIDCKYLKLILYCNAKNRDGNILKQNSLAINDTLSNKIILFSMITLIAMLAVGVIETLYIRRFLQKRKLI